jgi:ribosomal protein L29
MSIKNKSKEELLAEIDFLKRGGFAEQIGTVLQAVIKWSAFAFAAWCFKESVVAYAGKVSEANVLVSFLGKMEISNAIAWIFGAGGVVYGYKQRNLKGKTVERLQTRIKELEKRFDSQRTSSQLTTTGETNPKDIQA